MKKLINKKTGEIAFIDLYTNTITFSHSKTTHKISIQKDPDSHTITKITTSPEPIPNPNPIPKTISEPTPKPITNNNSSELTNNPTPNSNSSSPESSTTPTTNIKKPPLSIPIPKPIRKTTIPIIKYLKQKSSTSTQSMKCFLNLKSLRYLISSII